MGSAVPKWFGCGAKNLACPADILARVNGVFAAYLKYLEVLFTKVNLQVKT